MKNEEQSGTQRQTACWKRYLPPVLTIATGLLLSVIAFRLASDQAAKTIEADFRVAAGDRADVVRSAIGAMVMVVESVASFYRGSEEVTRDEFAEFVKPYFLRLGGTEALGWAPRVADAQRAQYEAGAGREGPRGLPITQPFERRRIVPASRRGEYFPLCLVEPRRGNEALLGLDLAADALQAEALAQSRDTDRLVAVRPMPVADRWGKQSLVVLLLPVYNKGLPAASVADRRKNLQGFVVGCFGLGRIVEQALSSQHPEGIDICLYRGAEATLSNRICFHASHTAKRSNDRTDQRESPEREGMHYGVTIEVGQQRWLIRCTPTEEFLAARRTWWPWGTLAIGLLVTGLLAAYLFVQTGQAARIRRLVDERTVRLRESESQFRAITTSAQDAIILIDDCGSISFWNEAATRIFGYSEEEAKGRDVHELLATGHHLLKSRAAFPRFQRTGQGSAVGKTVVLNAVRKNGEVFPVELSLSAVNLGQRWHATAIVRDISERQKTEAARKRTEIELAKARQAAELATHAKSQFLAKMSHELRTPMNSIIGFTNRLLKKLGPSLPERELDALQTVDRNARHLLTLINDILDLSKIEAGKMQLQPAEFDLTVAIQEVAKQMAPLAEAKPLALNLELPQPPIHVEADRTKILQIVTNLLSNGIKYTTRGSVTAAACEAHDEQLGQSVRITVRDTGIGIPPEDQRRLFQEFTQLDGKTGLGVGGTGLGLCIARQFVQMHGGRISLRSVPGQGSEFTVVLPRRQPAPAEHHPEAPPQRTSDFEGPGASSRASDGVKILCVDDEPDTLKYMYLTFQDAGYTVFLANDYESAIEQARTRRPDLICLDLRLPGKDGYEVLKALRSDPALAATPVVVVSVSDEKPSRSARVRAATWPSRWTPRT